MRLRPDGGGAAVNTWTPCSTSAGNAPSASPWVSLPSLSSSMFFSASGGKITLAAVSAPAMSVAPGSILTGALCSTRGLSKGAKSWVSRPKATTASRSPVSIAPRNRATCEFIQSTWSGAIEPD